MGLIDFYSTIVIVLIIVIFFFALKIKAEKVTNTITGEELGLDATQIALLYAQTPVETSKGTMTFGEFIGVVAKDTSLKDEFITATTTHFNALQQKTYVTIVLIQNDQSIVLIEPEYGFFDRYVGPGFLLYYVFMSGGDAYSTPSDVTIPLHTPNDSAKIYVQTKLEG